MEPRMQVPSNFHSSCNAVWKMSTTMGQKEAIIQRRLEEAWQTIPKTTLKKLQESLHKRVQAYV